MFSHARVGSRGVDRSKRACDAGPGMPCTGEPEAFGHGGNLGFKCSLSEQVRRCHDTAVAHGGTSIENPPGLREARMGALHLAYVHDPDGHKLSALHRPG